jgi:hypothetical protein
LGLKSGWLSPSAYAPGYVLPPRWGFGLGVARTSILLRRIRRSAALANHETPTGRQILAQRVSAR